MVGKESGVLPEKVPQKCRHRGICNAPWEMKSIHIHRQANQTKDQIRPKWTLIQFSPLFISGPSGIASKVHYGCRQKEAQGLLGPVRLQWITPLLQRPFLSSWSGHWQVTEETATFATFSVPDTEAREELGVWVGYLEEWFCFQGRL